MQFVTNGPDIPDVLLQAHIALNPLVVTSGDFGLAYLIERRAARC